MEGWVSQLGILQGQTAAVLADHSVCLSSSSIFRVTTITACRERRGTNDFTRCLHVLLGATGITVGQQLTTFGSGILTRVCKDIFQLLDELLSSRMASGGLGSGQAPQ